MDLLVITATIIFLAILGTFYLHPNLDFNPTPPDPRTIIQNLTTPAPTPNTHPHFSGQISSVARDLNLIIITPTNQPELNITVTSQTKLVNQDNNPITLDSFQKGFTIAGDGLLTGTDAITAASIKLVKSPSIVVFIPTPNSTVGAQFEVSGVGKVFGNQISVEIKNHSTGTIYSQGSVLTDTQNMAGFGNFYYRAVLKNTSDLQVGDTLDIEVSQRSAKDAGATELITVPAIYNP